MDTIMDTGPGMEASEGAITGRPRLRTRIIITTDMAAWDAACPLWPGF